ncbi:Hsp20/alpha crystallin family protein, partial [Paenibacillus larvae]
AMNMAPFIFWNLAFYTIIRTQLMGWPGQDEGKLISLPASIIPHKSKASFKEGYLQIKMPKMRNGNFHELQIRHLK